jgi:hypothetical protein
MKKYFYTLVIILSTISFSCEVDDFCTQTPVTPNLVLRFYDNDNITNTKTANRLSVIAETQTDSLYTDQTVDSLAIPLNGLATKTTYIFKRNEIDGNITNNEIDTLTITYTVEEEYISRSCGFRYIFNDVIINKGSTGWIDSLSTSQISTINNQIEAHVQVFH